MNRIGITVALVTALLLASPGMASAIEPDREDPHICWKVTDAVFIRPPSVVSSITATVLGAIIIPFAWPFGVAEEMVDDIIYEGWRFSLKRPLGDFSD